MRVLSIVLDYLCFLPPAFLCFLPMKDQLRYSASRTAMLVISHMLGAMLLLGFLQYRFDLSANTVLLPLLAVCFFIYKRCQKATLWQSLSIFCTPLALMSILSNLALCLNALLFGGSGEPASILLRTALLQLGLNILFSALLARPYMKTAVIVSEMPQSFVWQILMLFSIIVFAANMLLLPIEDAVRGDTSGLIYMLLVLTALLFLFLLMHAIFYFTVSEMLARAKAEERNRFLETQESQFNAQQRYMKETARIRHDFRHSIRTLAELYDSGDVEALGRYLHKYVNAMPVSEVKNFCDNTVLNALLNYYDHLTRQEQISFTVQVRLPEELPVPDVDLCSMIGNILENAVAACRKTEEKHIRLTIMTEDAAQLYIVAVNTFNGTVYQKDGKYLSTDRARAGIGLSSIRSTAEAYGGTVMFNHKGTEFYSNVAIPMGGRHR